MTARPVIAVDRRRQRASGQLIQTQYVPLYGRPFGDEQLEKDGPVDIVDMQARIPQTFRDPSVAPLRKLSVDLIMTYKHINEVYYARVRNRRAQEGYVGKTFKKEGRRISNDGRNGGYRENITKNGEKLLKREETDNVKEKGSLGQVVVACGKEEQSQMGIKVGKKKKKLFKIL